MNLDQILQITGIAAILAGPLSLIGSLLSDDAVKKYPSLDWLYFANSFFLVLAFLGIYLFQSGNGGLWAIAGFIVALLAVLLMERPGKYFGMQPYEFGGAVLSIASIFLAIASFQSNRFPLNVPTLLLAGIVLGIPSVFIPSYQRAGFILGGIGFGSAIFLAGIHILQNL